MLRSAGITGLRAAETTGVQLDSIKSRIYLPPTDTDMGLGMHDACGLHCACQLCNAC